MDDRIVALREMKAFRMLLKDVSERLRNDYDFVRSAVNVNPGNYRYASEDFRYDVDINSIDMSFDNIRLIPDEYLRNKDMIILAVCDDPFTFTNLSESWRCDYDVALAAVKRNGCSLRFVGGESRNDKNIIKNALRQNRIAWNYVNYEMKEDEEILSFYDGLRSGQ